jgi:hypothetical protein
MIDVFMLVRESIIKLDLENYSIPSIQFCECDAEQFAEIKDLIAKEDAGVFGRLEEVVLFRDDDFTAECPTLASIAAELEDERLQEDYERIDRLQLERTHIATMASFPYDFINLDFCDYYYPEPPDMLRINETVKRVLDWQRRSSEDGQNVQVDEFVLAVTCRHDDNVPKSAEDRLVALVKDNCATSDYYKEQLVKTRGTDEIQTWLGTNRRDFFFAGWPKDIGRCGKEYGWTMDILNYVYYERLGDHNNTYVIACLVARFKRSKTNPDYLKAALHALDAGNRHLERFAKLSRLA